MSDVPAVAIIGMAGRFPGAPSVSQLWKNLVEGRESIRRVTPAELRAAGFPEELINRKELIPASGHLAGTDLFDAQFFDIGAREAELLDPQHRMGMECAWSALEDAGYDPLGVAGPVGLFAGTGFSSYLIYNLLPFLLEQEVEDLLPYLTGTDKDHFVTRIAYKLNITGPCVSVNTTCSTGLVALHLACQSLLNGECNLALAGGVGLGPRHAIAYLYQEGGYFSPEGRVYPFDSRARGTVIGNGGGFVVLKRLEDALGDNDRIVAVVRGSAVNNDGHSKAGFSAPSVQSQTRVITEALAVSGIEVDTLRYVEAHGTGTAVGDPIELEALSAAIKAFTPRKGFCGVGSIKANIGHTGAGAGITGVIKAALSLKHRVIPPSINYEKPNPRFDFASSPLYVTSRLTPLEPGPTPLRMGVTSIGIGGINAHAVLEEAPAQPSVRSRRAFQVLPLSAKVQPALAPMAEALDEHLRSTPEVSLADAAYTLQTGRHALPWRRVSVLPTQGQATQSQAPVFEGVAPRSAPPIVFLFPGGGSQYPGMGRDLFESEPVFRKAFEQCAEISRAQFGLNLQEMLWGAQELPSIPSTMLPAVFAIEYALAQVLIGWGIKPTAMIGHSLGEYTAACLSGVMTLPEAMGFVCYRGRLLDCISEGVMLSVTLPDRELIPLLPPSVALAAVNSASRCVVAGSRPEVEAFERELSAKGVSCRWVPLRASGHSASVDPVLQDLRQYAARLPLRAPSIPYVSNVTGDWVIAAQAQSPAYWAEHTRRTVRFADGLRLAGRTAGTVFLEVGPGNVLASFATEELDSSAGHSVITTMRGARVVRNDQAVLLEAVGQAWVNGVPVAWSNLHPGERRQRTSLPTYAFQRKEFWIESSSGPFPTAASTGSRDEKRPRGQWASVPVWRRAPRTLLASAERQAGSVIVLDDGGAYSGPLFERLVAKGVSAVRVRQGFGAGDYTADFASVESVRALLAKLKADGHSPRAIYLMATTPGAGERRELLLPAYLAQALRANGLTAPVTLLVCTVGFDDVTGAEVVQEDRALALGPVRVIPFELANVSCKLVDLDGVAAQVTQQASLLAEELDATDEYVLAYRGAVRWTRDEVPVQLARTAARAPRLEQGGVYLITGGLGGMGLTTAKAFAAWKPRLVLLSRSGFSPRETWEELAAGTGGAGETARALLELEHAGAQVLVVRGDVSQKDELHCALQLAQARFGPIQGVVHTAGVNGFAPVETLTAAQAHELLSAKVDGTRNLWSLLESGPLDFMLLCSSLSTTTSAFGGAAYIAANAFLDQFAVAHCREDRLVTSIGWDYWDEVGMARRGSYRDTNPKLAGKKYIAPAEGAEVLLDVLSHGYSHVLISTRDLAAVKQRNKTELFAAEGSPSAATPSSISRPRHPRPPLSTVYEAPSTETELTIAAIWENAMGIQGIGVQDNFFELGGDSLMGVQVISKCRNAGLDVTVRQVFENPTIRGVARAAGAEKTAAVASAVTAGSAVSTDPLVEDEYPVTPLQAVMLAEGRREGGERSYVSHGTFILEGLPDTGLLARAWQKVVDRHPALRTAFVAGDKQRVFRKATLPVEQLDWASLAPAEQELRLKALLRADLERGFEMDQAPLVRLYLIFLGGPSVRTRVVVSHHQGILDGWSWRRVQEDLVQCTLGLAMDQPIPELDPASPFRRYVDWQQSQDPEHARAYWTQELRGLSPRRALESLYHLNGAPLDGVLRGLKTGGLTLEQTAAVASFARTRQVTPSTVVQAAWGLTLSAVSQEQEVIFGVTVSGRQVALDEVERVVGQCTNTLPLRLVPESTEAGLSALQRKNVQMREAAGFSLVEARKLLGLAPRTELYDTNLVFENLPSADLPAPDESVEAVRTSDAAWTDGWHFPLRVFVFPGESLGVSVAYDRALLADEAVDGILRLFLSNVRALAGLEALPATRAGGDPS